MPENERIRIVADEGDLAQIASDQHMQASMINRRRLQRIRETDNTHCGDCGEPIPEARRKAVPGCELCVACQTEYERGETWI